MTCVSCGARNTERATWCTQCFAPLGELGSAADADATDEQRRVEVAVGAEPAGAADASARDVRLHGDDVQWRCAGCDTWVELHRSACPTCDRPRSGFGDVDQGRERGPVTRTSALAASLVVPGAGHLLAGVVGSGIARAILGLLWLVGGLVLARGGGGASAGVLLLGAAVLWVVSAVDAVSLVDGDGRQLLTGRRLGALVAVVTGGLLLAITAAALAGAA